MVWTIKKSNTSRRIAYKLSIWLKKKKKKNNKQYDAFILILQFVYLIRLISKSWLRCFKQLLNVSFSIDLIVIPFVEAAGLGKHSASDGMYSISNQLWPKYPTISFLNWNMLINRMETCALIIIFASLHLWLTYSLTYSFSSSNKILRYSNYYFSIYKHNNMKYWPFDELSLHREMC